MSVQNQIDRITQNIASTYSELERKGATIPEAKSVDNLPGTAASIDVEAKHLYITKTLSTSAGIAGENNVYTLSFTDPLIKTDYKLEIAFDTANLLQLINDGVSNIRADNDNGTVNVICIGAKPTAELTAQISFVKLVQAE